MAKIPYLFHTPIPRYFWDTGFLDLKKKSFLVRFKFLHWAFSKCRNSPHEEVVDGIKVILQPWEFVFQREKSAIECGLSPQQARDQLEEQKNQLNLEKRTNSRANRFTVYMWSTDRFWKNENQLKNQLKNQLNPQISQDDIHIVKDDISIEYHHHRLDKEDDFFSSSIVFEYRKAKLTQKELDECLKVRGSEEEIKKIIDLISDWPERRAIVSRWCETICEWKVTVPQEELERTNEKIGCRYEYLLSLNTHWECRTGRDCHTKKQGFLFIKQVSAGMSEDHFIAFDEKAFEYKLKDKIKTLQLHVKEDKIVEFANEG